MTAISIRVDRFRNCAQADLSCSPICLIAGLNDAGKSSTLGAAAAALTGRGLEQFGLTKTKANLLVRSGAKTATVRVTTDAGEASMSWPEVEYQTKGDAPHASLFAAGLMSLPLIAPKDRPGAVEPYIKASPTVEDVRRELGEIFGAEAIEKIWKAIERDGWDEFHQTRVKQGTEWTGAWGQISGVRFGSEKARDWAPEGWDEMIGEAGVEQLGQNVREAKDALERALGAQAVDQAQLDSLRQDAGAVETRREMLAAADTALGEATAALAAATAAREALPPGTVPQTVACPHCGEAIHVNRKNAAEIILEKGQVLDPTDLEKRRLEIASADGECSRLQNEKTAAARIQAEATASLRAAEEATAKIAGMGDGPGAAGLVDAARHRVGVAESDLAMTEKVVAARALYKKWAINAKLVAALAPTGIRAKKLGEAVSAFNISVLGPLCEIARWPEVALTEELDTTVGGFVYSLCGDSHKMRGRIILQLAQARLDGSSMVVIDAADTLDTVGRNGLFQLLRSLQMPALVGMTLGRPELVPDLAKAAMGCSYWISKGVTAPLGQQQQEAAQ